MTDLNRAWHEKHIKPKNPTLEERIKWHMAHEKHCGCRPIPEKLLVEMRKRKIKRAKPQDGSR